MKCLVISCPAKLKTQEDLKRHMRVVHAWATFLRTCIFIFLSFLSSLSIVGCTDMGRAIFGPDVKQPQAERWQEPDCKGLSVQACCTLDQKHMDMCQTLGIMMR